MNDLDASEERVEASPEHFALIAAEGDALCAAAAVLLRHQGARIVVAHPSNLVRLLIQLKTKYGQVGQVAASGKSRRGGRVSRQVLREQASGAAGKSVHLIGLTPEGEPALLMEVLRDCRHAGIEPVWHDGRGMISAAWRKTLASCGRLNVSSDAGTHTAAVIQALGLERDRRAQRLARVAAFLQPPEASPARRGKPSAELIEDADYVSALLEYALYAHDASDFTERTRAWVLESARDAALLSHWRGEGRPLNFDGHSPQIRMLWERIARIAPYEDATVLILGPSGAGKEVAASLIHRQSGRTGPFVAVNCATLAGEAGMVNARLFGHARGAFTGAVKEGRGVFEAAEGGTLLMDEVAELPLDTQARLLRVLEEGTYTRVGDEQTPRRANVRIIAATHRDLGAMTRERQFRDDLLFRRNVLQVRVPALAERLQDIEDLAYTLHAKLGRKHHRAFPALRPDHVATLQTYAWPGNVRQLRTILERALLLGMLDRLDDLLCEERLMYGPSEPGSMSPGEQTIALASASDSSPPTDSLLSPGEVLPLREANRRHILAALQTMSGNITRAARALGISVNRLKRLLQNVK